MDPEQVLTIEEPAIGLHAVIVLDSTALGPAAGGVRTARYATLDHARAEAAALARSMTLKCSLAGLDAGGGKAVIVEQEGWDRAAVFRRFGEIVESLDGQFRTAGDLGTGEADLQAMASTCQYVHTQERALGDAVAQGLVACLRSLAAARDRELSSLAIAVQGCGAIGAALARALQDRVASLYLSDLDAELARRMASECAAMAMSPDDFIAAPVDVLSPCAVGGVLHRANAGQLQAWGVCGGANQIVADAATHLRLFEQGLLVVPDLVASAGAVIDGIGDTLMQLPKSERDALIEKLGDTAQVLLAESARRKIPTQVAAERLAMSRLP